MSNEQHLLDVVLNGSHSGANPNLDPILQRTLLEVRRNQIRRRRQRVVIAFGATTVVVGLIFSPLVPRGRQLHSTMDSILTTQPLPPESWLTTQSGSAPVVDSSQESVVMISTRQTLGEPSIVSDDELLNLAQNEPAALVRNANGQPELILLAGRSTTVSQDVLR